jgi:CBS-domain-containing membrane protein
LQIGAAVALGALLLGYALKFGAHSFNAVSLAVNGVLLLAAVLLLWAALPHYGRQWNRN